MTDVVYLSMYDILVDFRGSKVKKNSETDVGFIDLWSLFLEISFK